MFYNFRHNTTQSQRVEIYLFVMIGCVAAAFIGMAVLEVF